MEAKFTLSKKCPIDATFKITAILSEETYSKFKARIEALEKALPEEVERAQSAEQELSDRIDAEVERATLAEENLQSNIEDEALARQVADNELRELITQLEEKTEQEIQDLDEKVDGINANLNQRIDELQQDVNDKYDDLVEDIDDLAEIVDENKTASEQRDTALGERIDAEVTARTEADNTINEKINVIETDIANIETDIENLEDRIDTVEDNSIVKIDYNATDIGVTVTYGDGETEDVLFTNLATDAELQAETTARTDADTALSNRIDTLDQRVTDVADELNQTIEDNVVALQQEDTALQNQINQHSQDISALDTRITYNSNAITQEVANRIVADSALQDQIDSLSARGRYLTLWDATTGLAMTNPTTTIYDYRTGDYFIVGKVGDVNYRPTGKQYVVGQASTVEETEELAVDDTYLFDGESWHLQINHGKTVSFANLAGQPTDNVALKAVLDTFQLADSYASDTKSGVIFANSNLGFTVNSLGEPMATTFGADVYLTKSDWTFISKGTLENIKEDYLLRAITSEVLTLTDAQKKTVQDKLGITDELAKKQDVLTSANAGDGISIENGIISNTRTSAEWGNIKGNLDDQIDLKNVLDLKVEYIVVEDITITIPWDIEEKARWIDDDDKPIEDEEHVVDGGVLKISNLGNTRFIILDE